MTGARVLVVEHQGNAGAGLVGQRLAGLGLELHTVGPDTGRAVPDSLEGFDALVVLGGAMGPTEDEKAPWLPATRALLAAGVEQQMPTLGICLGAQLLVTATGSTVRNMPDGPEVGLNAVTFAPGAEADPVFGGLAGTVVPAVQWHWLEADALPAEATLLASSASCRNQAFRIGEKAWGVQFHPEALTATAVGWADEDRESLVELGRDEAEVIGEILAAEADLVSLWSTVADRFAAVITDAAGARAVEAGAAGVATSAVAAV